MTALPETVLFAVDFSGSTHGQSEYWPRVGTQFENAVAEYGDAVRCILWDTSLVFATHAEMRARVATKAGRGGTNPTPVAEYIRTHAGTEFTLRKLIVITDGQISPSDVDKCDTVLAQIRADSQMPAVEACLFGPYQADLSVVAPFARAAEFTIRQNDAVLAQGDARVDIADGGLLDAIDTPADFLAQYDRLHAAVVVQNLGRQNLQLRDCLLALKTRLLTWIAVDNQRRAEAEVSVVAADAPDVPRHPIAAALEAGEFAGAVSATRDLVLGVVAETGDLQTEVSDKILKLVDACTLKSFSVDALRSRRAQRAPLLAAPTGDEAVPAVAAAADDAEDIAAAGTNDAAFECPIMLDAAAPVLLIASAGEPVLHGAETWVIDDVTDCPLNLLKYPALVARVVERIDHAIGAEAFVGVHSAAASDWQALRSPFTRAPLAGCIPFGNVAQHVRLGSWVARKLMTDGAVLGNAHLWLATVYFIVRDHIPRLAENAALMDAFRAHLAHRLTEHETNIALSGLAGYPLVKTPVAVALWYVVAGSTALFANDPTLYGQERLRQFWGVTRYMRALVEDVVGWPVVDATAPRVAGLDAVDRRAATLRVWSALMARKDDMDKLRRDLRRMYQGHVILSRAETATGLPANIDLTTGDEVGDDEDKQVVVMVDGPCTPEQAAASPLAWTTELLPLAAVVKLGALVSPSLKVGSVVLRDAVLFADDDVAPVATTHYAYDYGAVATKERTEFMVCPATLRPWTYDARDVPSAPELWSDRAARVFGAPVDRLLSAYNYFIEYVTNFKAYPASAADLLAFMASRERNRIGRPARDTLPTHVVTIVCDVLADYTAAFAAREGDGGRVLPAHEFAAVAEASRGKDERRAIEIEWVRSVGDRAAHAVVVEGIAALAL